MADFKASTFALGHELRLKGDFYGEPDDVYRGVTLSAASLMYSDDGVYSMEGEPTQSRFASDMVFGLEPKCLSQLQAHEPCAERDQQIRFLIGTQCQDATTSTSPPEGKYRPEPDLECVGRPREVPCGGASCTSVVLGNMCALEAMKALHMFFQSTLMTSITKSRPEKCWISAHAIVHEGPFLSSCSVKARLFCTSESQSYTDEPQELVIQLDRQSGDALAFIQVFKNMQMHLQEYFSISSGSRWKEPHSRTESNVELTKLQNFDATELANNLQPLKDAMGMTTCPAIQAEALAALAVVASMDALSIAMYGIQVGSETLLSSLVASPSPAIAYPATYLARQIALYKGGSSELQVALERSPFRHLIC